MDVLWEGFALETQALHRYEYEAGDADVVT